MFKVFFLKLFKIIVYPGHSTAHCVGWEIAINCQYNVTKMIHGTVFIDLFYLYIPYANVLGQLRPFPS